LNLLSPKQFAIGSLTLANNLLLAPMAGITNLPMRLIARESGAALCFTEMVSANGLVREGKKSFELLQSTLDDRPLGIQIFGDDPSLLAESARLVEGYGDLIDINMGCPVKKVVNCGAGSALMRDPSRVRDILSRVRRATPLPLTIKMRTGWQADETNYLEIARIAEGEGCDAITLHPRSRSQMFGGNADWTRISELEKTVKTPVIGSGDLFTSGDVLAMLDQTGCDGVMIARGALGYPWIFRESLQIMNGEDPTPPSPSDRLAVILRHLELFAGFAGEKAAVREMRKHLSWYVRGIPGAALFRSRVNTIMEKEPLMQLLHEFFTETEITNG
jgi:tRNA-dihydrouridine synthase B